LYNQICFDEPTIVRSHLVPNILKGNNKIWQWLWNKNNKRFI